MFAWLVKLIIEPLGFGKQINVLERAVCESASVRQRYLAASSVRAKYQSSASVRTKYDASATVRGC